MLRCYALQRNYYISIIAQAEGGDFHGSARWFQGMQDLCKKYGMNVSNQHMIAKLHFLWQFLSTSTSTLTFSLFNFYFLNIPLLPFRSQLIIDEVQTGGGATGRLREASQTVQNNPQFVKFISIPRKDVDARTFQSSRWD